MNNPINFRLPPELRAALEKYQADHDLPTSQALRIAIDRLLRRPPSAKEIAQAHSPTGAAAHRERT